MQMEALSVSIVAYSDKYFVSFHRINFCARKQSPSKHFQGCECFDVEAEKYTCQLDSAVLLNANVPSCSAVPCIQYIPVGLCEGQSVFFTCTYVLLLLLLLSICIFLSFIHSQELFES